jgi:hypothetical protein
MTALLTFTSLRSSAPPHPRPCPSSNSHSFARPARYPFSRFPNPRPNPLTLPARSPRPSPTPTAAADLILRRSKVIEETIFKSFNSTTSNDYRQKIRSLYMNLADTKNPDLREAVVSGEIKAERLGTMSSQVSSIPLHP